MKEITIETVSLLSVDSHLNGLPSQEAHEIMDVDLLILPAKYSEDE